MIATSETVDLCEALRAVEARPEPLPGDDALAARLRAELSARSVWTIDDRGSVIL